MKPRIVGSETKQSEAPLHKPVEATLGELERLSRVSPVRVMYPRLERLCRPRSESFWILGGRPGAFKTGLAWNLALNVAEQRQRALFVSLEMTTGQMGLLALTRFSGLERRRLEDAFMATATRPLDGIEQRKMEVAHDRINALALTLRLHGEQHGRDVDDVIRSATRSRFDAVFVDHLGMIGRDSGGRELDVLSQAIHRLRGLSRGEAVEGYRPWVVATTQLSREIDKGDAPRIPRMSDFRGSARIEHDADVAIGLQKRPHPSGDDCMSLIDAFVLKNRNGECPAALCFEANGATGMITQHEPKQSAPQHWLDREDE